MNYYFYLQGTQIAVAPSQPMNKIQLNNNNNTLSLNGGIYLNPSSPYTRKLNPAYNSHKRYVGNRNSSPLRIVDTLHQNPSLKAQFKCNSIYDKLNQDRVRRTGSLPTRLSPTPYMRFAGKFGDANGTLPLRVDPMQKLNFCHTDGLRRSITLPSSNNTSPSSKCNAASLHGNAIQRVTSTFPGKANATSNYSDERKLSQNLNDSNASETKNVVYMEPYPIGATFAPIEEEENMDEDLQQQHEQFSDFVSAPQANDNRGPETKNIPCKDSYPRKTTFAPIVEEESMDVNLQDQHKQLSDLLSAPQTPEVSHPRTLYNRIHLKPSSLYIDPKPRIGDIPSVPKSSKLPKVQNTMSKVSDEKAEKAFQAQSCKISSFKHMQQRCTV